MQAQSRHLASLETALERISSRPTALHAPAAELSCSQLNFASIVYRSPDRRCLTPQVEDHLAAFDAFRVYKRRGLDARLAFYRAADLPAGLRTWVFQLCRTNMKVGWCAMSLLAALKGGNAS